jgi:hypothetical protein
MKKMFNLSSRPFSFFSRGSGGCIKNE